MSSTVKVTRLERVAAALLACAVLGALYFPPDARAASRSFRAEAGVDEKYDDLALYVIVQTLTSSAVSKKGDWITEPYLTLSYTSSRRLPTKLVFDFTADVYAKYPIQDYQTFRLLIRQAIDEKTAVAVKYTFIPEIFFGDDIVCIAPCGTPYKDQQHEIHLVQGTVDRDLLPDLNLGLTAKYGIRDAKPRFNYRDYSLWGVSMDGIYRLGSELKLSGGASYEQDTARGGTNAFIVPSVPDDATYDQVSAYAGLTYSIAEGWLLKGRYTYRWRDYTTSLSGDTLHYGRTDSTHSLLLLATYRLAASLYLKAGYEGIWKDSTKSYARYQENIYTVGVSYRY